MAWQGHANAMTLEEKETEALDRFLHHPGAETTGAYANTLGGAIDHRTNGLKIRPEDPVGLIVGMADIMPGLMTFATNLTYKCHGLHSFSTDSLY
jgi:hypothetical protein